MVTNVTSSSPVIATGGTKLSTQQIKTSLKLVADKLSAADLPNPTLPNGVFESPKYKCNRYQRKNWHHQECKFGATNHGSSANC